MRRTPNASFHAPNWAANLFAAARGNMTRPTINRYLRGVAGVTAVALLLLNGGCASLGMLSPVTSDLREILKEPAVQATLQAWSAQADVTNPAFGFYIVNGGEIRMSGVIVRGGVSGAGRSGLDPALLKILVQIAAERGYVAPTPPPPSESPAPATPAPPDPDSRPSADVPSKGHPVFQA